MTVQDIKALFGNLIEYFTDEEAAKDVREGLDTEFDSQVTTDGVYNSYVRISYFNDGWKLQSNFIDARTSSNAYAGGGQSGQHKPGRPPETETEIHHMGLPQRGTCGVR